MGLKNMGAAAVKSFEEVLRLLPIMPATYAPEVERRILLARTAMTEALQALTVRYDANIGATAEAQLRAALEALR